MFYTCTVGCVSFQCNPGVPSAFQRITWLLLLSVSFSLSLPTSAFLAPLSNNLYSQRPSSDSSQSQPQVPKSSRLPWWQEMLLLPQLHQNEWKESNMFVNRQQAPPPQLSYLIRLGADSWEHALVTFQFAIWKWGANNSACLLHLNPGPLSCYRNWFW